MTVHNQTDLGTVVYFPFASGNVVEIELSCHEDEGGDRPLKTYPLYDAGVDMVRTADCAGETACRLAREDSMSCGRHSIGYLLKPLPPEASISGESGGLAMALALYCELTSLHAGQIAATGCLAGIRGDEVLSVKGVEGKLHGILEKLDRGAKVFIPAGNENELFPELIERFAAKEIGLYPVATVREAIRIVKEKTDGSGKKRSISKLWLLGAGIVTAIGVGLWIAYEPLGIGESGKFASPKELTQVQETHQEVAEKGVAVEKPLAPAEQMATREPQSSTPQFSKGFE